MPFHFAGDVPPGFGDETLGTPDVLRHFANIGYGDFDYVPDLHRGIDPQNLPAVRTIVVSRVRLRGGAHLYEA
jgi:hypothetical protein